MTYYISEYVLSYFPVLLDISNSNIVLVGAGEIALFKFNKIVEYNPKKLTVISKSFMPDFHNVKRDYLTLVEKNVELQDVDSADIVIVAIDDTNLQQEIYDYCKRKKIMCNCVDEIKRCDFIFPSTIKKGDITISISSSGKVPGFSVSLKEYIEELIPSEVESKFLEMVQLRKSLPSGKERMKFIRETSKEFFMNFKRNSK